MPLRDGVRDFLSVVPKEHVMTHSFSDDISAAEPDEMQSTRFFDVSHMKAPLSIWRQSTLDFSPMGQIKLQHADIILAWLDTIERQSVLIENCLNEGAHPNL